MTVSSEVSKSGPYLCNGLTDVFPYNSRIVDERHLNVTLTKLDGAEIKLDLATHYTVSGVGNLTGGSINLTMTGMALAVNGTQITMLRDVPFVQELDLENQGAYHAEDVERSLDLALMRDQQLLEVLGRTVKIPASADPAQLDSLLGDIARLTESVDNIDIVAGAAGAIGAVATDIADVSAVAAQLDTLTALPDIASQVLSAVPNAFPLTKAALKALPTNTVTSAYLMLAGAEGQWGFRLGNFAASIASDPAESNFIKADDKAASVGAWIRTDRQEINAKDFGAKCDGITDDTLALQRAIDFCHLFTPTARLNIPGMSLISASLVINRAVDASDTTNWFKIASSNGGGIKVNTAIPIFTSTLAPLAPTMPLSQSVYFDHVSFEASNAALAAYVLNSNKLMRMVFAGCSFNKIKFASTTDYLQSIYLIGCVARYWTGEFLVSSGGSYDIRLIGNLIEHGAEGFRFTDGSGAKSVAGISIDGNCIEGLTGTALRVGGARGFSLTNNYFEANAGPDILARGFAGSAPNRGINHTGNLHAQSAANLASPSYASCVWGDDEGFSAGNFSDGYMHTRTAGCKMVFEGNSSLMAEYNPSGDPMFLQSKTRRDRFISVPSPKVMGSNASPQTIFDGTGAISLRANTNYEFEADYYLDRTSGVTAHTIATLFAGTATYALFKYRARTTNPATPYAISNPVEVTGDAPSALTVTLSNGSATEYLHVHLRGQIITTGAGTMIPQFKYSAGPGSGPTIAAGTRLRIWEIGDAGVSRIGT